MTFEEAGQGYTRLREEVTAGRMNREEFILALDELRVQDESGVWWQLSESGQWLFWNGTTWITSQRGTGGGDFAQQTLDDFRRTAQGLQQNATLQQIQRYANNPASFMNEFRHVPLMKRPQIWWDTLSVGGGIASGGLWFLYSSIRGMREGFDWLTVIIMVGLPIFLALFRGPLDKLLIPFQQYRNRMPRLVLVGVGLALPFLVANITYGMFIQYSYLHVNLIVGTMLSYLVLRNPAR